MPKIVTSKSNDEEKEMSRSTSDLIDLGEVWRIIWWGKWKIISMTLIITACTIYYSLSIADEYESTAILIPSSSSGTSAISKLAGQFGGLASLAGVDLSRGKSGDKTTIAIELIKTWGFLESFIEANGLEIEVFAVKGWDRQKNVLIVDDNLYDESKSVWVRKVDVKKGQTVKPTGWELFEAIKGKITVKKSKHTGFVTIGVTHYSPYVAKKWVDLLVVAINEHIQLQDKNDALTSIKYLKSQAAITTISEMQTVFFQLIEEQTKILMLAEISREYVLKTLSGAKVAERKIRPRRAVTVVLGAVIGFFVSLLVVFFLNILKRRTFSV